MHMPKQPFLQIPLVVTLPRIPQQALRCKNHSRGNCLPWEDHELRESGQSSFLLPGPGNRLYSLHPVGKGSRLLFIWYAAVQKSQVSPFSTYLFLNKSHQQGGDPGSTSQLCLSNKPRALEQKWHFVPWKTWVLCSGLSCHALLVAGHLISEHLLRLPRLWLSEAELFLQK